MTGFFPRVIVQSMEDVQANNFESRVNHTIRRYGLIEQGDSVVVGVSGGPDSVALLNVLVELNRLRGWGCRLYVAHLNHMLRDRESREDEHFVRTLAESLGLPITVKEVDVRQSASRMRCSVETAARRLRHTFFEELASEISARRVAVGHSADDNAETVLHRIIRGAGLLGLGGIRPLRRLSPGSEVMLVRPLLYTWRREVLAYLEEKALKYRIDTSNLRPENFRNRIRLELLPLLEEKYNPQIKEALNRLGDIAGRSNDFLKSRIDRMVGANLKKTGEGIYSFEADLLKHHPPFFQHFFLREVLSRIGVPLGKMDYGHYNQLIEMVEGRGFCRQMGLPGHWTAYLENDMLYLRRPIQSPETHAPAFKPVELDVPGVTKLPDGREVRAEIVHMDKDGKFLEGFKAAKTPYEELLDADKVGKKLYVRTRREGDRFWPLGVEGEKKLKDFFIDAKTPRWKRVRVLIVTSDAHIVWVVGHRIDERAKITPDTVRALKLSVY